MSNGDAKVSNGEVLDENTAAMVVSPAVALENFKRGLEPRGIVEAKEIATILFNAKIGGASSPEEMFARIMFGREFGLTAMNAASNVYIVNGRGSLDANVMYALCLQNPACEFFRPVSSDDKKATFVAKRKGDPEVVLSWTIEEAADAGLLGGRDNGKGGKTEIKDNWRNYPRNMLRARCIANLARMVFPDSVKGMCIPDEASGAAPEPQRVHVEARVVDEKKAAADAARDALLKDIADAKPEDRDAIREKIQAAQKSGALPSPWGDEVVAAFKAKYPRTKAATNGQPAAAATPTEPAPPPAAGS